jgi:hypothetical protein
MKEQSQGFRRGLGRWLADFGLALSLFWLGVVAFGGSQNHAHAIPLPTRAAATVDRPVSLNVHSWGRAAQTELRVLRESRQDYPHTLILLSVAFAGLAACNLAFLRHLRRAYASPRRSVWRRG